MFPEQTKLRLILSLESYGPKIWNALSFNIKTAGNLSAFKTLIERWGGAYAIV